MILTLASRRLLALAQAAAAFIVFNGVRYGRAQDDDGSRLSNDDGSPLYIEV